MEDFYTGTNIFPLPNGDVYVGDFCAHRNGLLWREGNGFYQTQDGHIYEGIWKSDKLVDNGNVGICFPTGEYFDGSLLLDKFNDSGTFTFKDGLRLLAAFRNNKPEGPFQIIDTNGELWHGCSTNQDIASARREHSFFANIPAWRGLKKRLIEMQADFAALCTTSPISSNASFGDRGVQQRKVNLEKRVFEKHDILNVVVEDWFKSPWYDDYVRYIETREYILQKVARHRILNTREGLWYHKYLQSKRVASKMAVGEMDTTQLDRFYSKRYRDHPRPCVQIRAVCTAPPTSNPATESCEDNATQRSGESPVLTSSQSSTDTRPSEHSEQESEEEEEEDENEEEEKTLDSLKRNVFCQSDSLFDYVEITTGRRVPKRCNSANSN